MNISEIPKHGIFKIYYENGQLQEETNYSNGKQNGFSKSYNKETGKLVQECTFINDKYEGVLRKYNEDNGLIAKETNYKNNVVEPDTLENEIWKECTRIFRKILLG